MFLDVHSHLGITLGSIFDGLRVDETSWKKIFKNVRKAPPFFQFFFPFQKKNRKKNFFLNSHFFIFILREYQRTFVVFKVEKQIVSEVGNL